MSLSGIIGTLTGFATCGLMIYKNPNSTDAMAWLIALASFTTGVGTYFTIHELMVQYLPRHIVEFLEGDIDKFYTLSKTNWLTNSTMPVQISNVSYTPSSYTSSSYTSSFNFDEARRAQDNHHYQMKQNYSNFVESQKQDYHERKLRGELR